MSDQSKRRSRPPIGNEMIGLRRGGAKKLIFDVNTGELLIGPKQAKSKESVHGPDSVVIDQIYQTGFFATA